MANKTEFRSGRFLSLFVRALLVLILVTGMLPALSGAAQTANLALNKPVACSSVQHPCDKAVDGNQSTRWASAQGVDPQWIYVDLGQSYTITQVILRWDTAYATAFQIQTSTDAATWITIYSTTAGIGGDLNLYVSVSGRYVRMYGTARATTEGYSLSEFEVYGSSSGQLPTSAPATNTPTRTSTATAIVAGCGSTNIALNKPAISSSNEKSDTTPNLAVDGNTSTRWSSVFSDPQWIYVDLGSTQSICHVRLNWETAFGKSYQIQTSSDASTWTNIYSTTTGDGGIDDLTGLSGSGRYIRMYGTIRGTTFGYSLWEFQVYSSSGGTTATNAPTPTKTSTPANTPTKGSLPTNTATSTPTRTNTPIGPTNTPTPTPHGQYTTLVWSDEFNGSSLDTNNWNIETGGTGNGNNELQYYTNGQNISFSGGSMIITARRENPANYQCWYGTCTYTSSRINTRSKHEFTYGRMEARIQIPYGQGLWPTFWMLGNDYSMLGWPNCGEVDIMENIGREPSTIHGTVHGPGYSGANGLGGPYTLPSGQFHDAYHVFAVEWESNVFRWYVDGILYFTLTRTTVETHGQWVFDHPNFIILNVAVGGTYPGSPDGTTVFPQQMKVDYVRVYQ